MTTRARVLLVVLALAVVVGVLVALYWAGYSNGHRAAELAHQAQAEKARDAEYDETEKRRLAGRTVAADNLAAHARIDRAWAALDARNTAHEPTSESTPVPSCDRYLLSDADVRLWHDIHAETAAVARAGGEPGAALRAARTAGGSNGASGYIGLQLGHEGAGEVRAGQSGPGPLDQSSR